MKEYFTTAIFNKYFKYFNIHEKSASLYGVKKEDIIKVKVTIHEDQTILPFEQQRTNKEPDYWAFISNDDTISSLIWHQRFLLNVCFTYGIEAAENNGDGKAYRVNVTKIEE